MKENKILAQLILDENNPRESLISRAKALLYEGADGIILCETYSNDIEHEKNLHTLISLCKDTDIDIYAHVSKDNLEDVKKYLYAGCKGVVIKEEHSDLLKESAGRFGTPKEPKGKSASITSIDDKRKALKFSDFKTVDGLIPCIVQDYSDGTVLMMAYMNEESFNATLETKTMTYFSRSRNKLWKKGEESGHFQYLKNLSADCDNDTLLAQVEQVGVACHTGARSCFFKDIIGHNDYNNGFGKDVLKNVYEIIIDRKLNPKEGSYTNYLFDKGVDKILKKVGEECTEIVIAAKNPESEEIIYEIADFIYHVSVLMAQKNITWADVYKELENR